MLGLLTRGVLLIAGLASLGIVWFAAELSVLAAVFAVWVVSPYYPLFRATRKNEPDTVRDGAILVASVGVAAFALVIYYDAFFVHPDPQSGLLFLFMPLWQWCGVAVLMLLLWLWSIWAHRRG